MNGDSKYLNKKYLSQTTKWIYSIELQ